MGVPNTPYSSAAAAAPGLGIIVGLVGIAQPATRCASGLVSCRQRPKRVPVDVDFAPKLSANVWLVKDQTANQLGVYASGRPGYYGQPVFMVYGQPVLKPPDFCTIFVVYGQPGYYTVFNTNKLL